MDIDNIVKLDHSLSKLMICIIPYPDHWNMVSFSDLEKLHEFLSVNQENFELLILQQLSQSGSLVPYHVENIYSNLIKYRKWRYFCDSIIKNASNSNDEELRRKAEMANEVYIDTEIMWLTYLIEVYPQLDQENCVYENLMPAEQYKIDKKSSEKNEQETEAVYAHFKGRYDQQKLHCSILQQELNGKKGTAAACWLMAADQLGWIDGPIEWDILQKYFGVMGSKSGVLNHYNSNKRAGLDKTKLNSAMEKLRRLEERGS